MRKQRDRKRVFQVAGGKPVKLAIACSGLVVSVLPFNVYLFRDKTIKNQAPNMVHVKVDNAPEGHFAVHPKARPSHLPKP